MLDTLSERLTLARRQKMPHQDLLLQVLSDEVTRRDSLVQKARLDPYIDGDFIDGVLSDAQRQCESRPVVRLVRDRQRL